LRARSAAQVAVMSANEVLQELSRVARGNMLYHMHVGSRGDPGQAAALVVVTVADFVDGRGENGRDA
jgi:hypothetical protein